MKTFAEQLKAARKGAGISQQGMADRMLIPKRTIEKWETGERTPPEYVQRFVLNELRTIQENIDAQIKHIVKTMDRRVAEAKLEAINNALREHSKRLRAGKNKD